MACAHTRDADVNQTSSSQFSSHLQLIYDCTVEELAAHLDRFSRLLSSFHSRYAIQGASPDAPFLVRAPGRVNLIGEHTDYNGYPVLPMTIDRDLLLAVQPRKGGVIEIVNLDDRFGSRIFHVEESAQPYERGDWGNYVKAAVHGLIAEGVVKRESLRGFRAVLHGSVPESSGLSSSSALVVASGLAFLAVNAIEVDRMALAELLARAERFVGMEGGGMDQATSLLGRVRAALKIDFFPLRVRPVSLPIEVALIVCNSLVRAAKSSAARDAYNRRVIECRLAALLLSSALGRMLGRTVESHLLSELSAERCNIKEEEMMKLARQTFGEEPLFLKDIAGRIGTEAEGIIKKHLTLKDGSVLIEPKDGFKLWSRYRHVVTEARRVEEAVKCLETNDLPALGDLMNASHASCRDDYEVSCEELDLLVELARRHGALGARLTGAGFGGCTVNLVPVERMQSFLAGMRKDYYETYIPSRPQVEWVPYQSMNDAIFRCRASAAAGTIQPSIFWA